MTDGWARSTNRHADVRSVVVVEVPLTGPDDHSGVGTDSEPPPTDWRRAITIALVGGAALGIGGSALILSADDEPEPTSTTLSTDEIAAAITTPPTLGPPDGAISAEVTETLPPPDFLGDETATQTDVTVPTYPGVPGAGLDNLLGFDIRAGVEQLADDVARRSETHLELGAGGYVLDVTIERDPVRDRYQVVIESRNTTQVAIVDVSSGVTYINPGTDNRVDVLNAEIVADSSAADINEVFDRLLVGPLRPDTYNAPSTRGRQLVTIDGVGVVREFVTSISGELISEWQLYAFSPVFEFPVEDRPAQLEYHVYVTEDGLIAEVDGVSLVGDVPQLVQHRITVLDETPLIDLPEPVVATIPPVSTVAGT